MHQKNNRVKIVLASSNPGKIEEIRTLTASLPIDWTLQTKLNIADADETGTTFIENAIIKARHAAALSKLPALADDSGLEVDALEGRPGVHTARYVSKQAAAEMRNQQLLREMEGTKEAKRTARYHCVLALMRHENDPSPLICHGIWEGRIALTPQGKNGFGYDPIFFVPTHGCTSAELSAPEKNRISHRGQVMAQFVTAFNESRFQRVD